MKITQGIGKQIGRYYVVVGAEPTPTDTFSPIFEIHDGSTSSAEIIHEQNFSAANPTFATQNEAFDAAEAIAAKWITATPNVVGDATDEELARPKAAPDNELLRAPQSQDLLAVVESMRRLKEALRKEEKAIKWLTIVLVALTLIIYIHPPAGD
jgi:hypothetical protein